MLPMCQDIEHEIYQMVFLWMYVKLLATIVRYRSVHIQNSTVAVLYWTNGLAGVVREFGRKLMTCMPCCWLCPIIESTQSHIAWCSAVTLHYNTISFLPNTNSQYTFAPPWERSMRSMWVKMWAQIMSSMFLSHRSIVFSIVLEWTVLYIRHNYKAT